MVARKGHILCRSTCYQHLLSPSYTIFLNVYLKSPNWLYCPVFDVGGREVDKECRCSCNVFMPLTCWQVKGTMNVTAILLFYEKKEERMTCLIHIGARMTFGGYSSCLPTLLVLWNSIWEKKKILCWNLTSRASFLTMHLYTRQWNPQLILVSIYVLPQSFILLLVRWLHTIMSLICIF